MGEAVRNHSDHSNTYEALLNLYDGVMDINKAQQPVMRLQAYY